MAPIGRARAPCHGRQPGLPVVSTSSVAIPAAAGLPHLIDQQLAQPLVLPMSRDGQVDELAHEREVAGGARTAHEPLPPFKPAAAAPRGVHVHGHHHRAGVERARQLLLGEAPLGCHARPRGRLEAQLQQLGRVDRARAAAHAHAPRHRIPRSYCNSSSSSSSGCGSTGAWASCPAGGARTEQYRRKKGKQNKKKRRRRAGRGAGRRGGAPRVSRRRRCTTPTRTGRSFARGSLPLPPHARRGPPGAEREEDVAVTARHASAGARWHRPSRGNRLRVRVPACPRTCTCTCACARACASLPAHRRRRPLPQGAPMRARCAVAARERAPAARGAGGAGGRRAAQTHAQRPAAERCPRAPPRRLRAPAGPRAGADTLR